MGRDGHLSEMRLGRGFNQENRKADALSLQGLSQVFQRQDRNPMAESKIPLQKWATAIFLYATNLKGVSSRKLHRDLNITQRSAWYMLHRIRESFATERDVLSGTVEVDETFGGGLERNKHESRKLHAGRGGTDKSIVLGVKERESRRVRAKVIEDTKRPTLHGYIGNKVEPGSTVNTDDFKSYEKLDGYSYRSVRHSVGEYVDKMAHINGIESFWPMLKGAHKGVYHKFSRKNLNRYVNEFVVLYNIRGLNTVNQMEVLVAGMIGRRIMCKDLVSGEDGRLN